HAGRGVGPDRAAVRVERGGGDADAALDAGAEQEHECRVTEPWGGGPVLFPYTTLFRSGGSDRGSGDQRPGADGVHGDELELWAERGDLQQYGVGDGALPERPGGYAGSGADGDDRGGGDGAGWAAWGGDPEYGDGRAVRR